MFDKSSDIQDTLWTVQYKTLRFIYNNEDSTKFGVQFVEHDLPIGEAALVIDDRFAFIVDQYHNNIKRIDLETGQIISSKKLSQKRLFLNDIVIFRNLLYVSTELDTIFVLGKDFSKETKFFLKKGRSSFSRIFGIDSLILFYPDLQEYITLSGENKLINERKVSFIERGNEVFYKNKYVKNIGPNLYQTIYGIVKTKEDLLQNDVDFDSIKMVVARQDSSSLILLIFNYQRNKD